MPIRIDPFDDVPVDMWSMLAVEFGWFPLNVAGWPGLLVTNGMAFPMKIHSRHLVQQPTAHVVMGFHIWKSQSVPQLWYANAVLRLIVPAAVDTNWSDAHSIDNAMVFYWHNHHPDLIRSLKGNTIYWRFAAIQLEQTTYLTFVNEWSTSFDEASDDFWTASFPCCM